MIPVLTSSQLKELDHYTIREEPIASLDLMERACRAFVTWFVERYDVTHQVGIVCGTGNNGGDGLAIARMLIEWNYPVEVWIVRDRQSEDFAANRKRLRSVVHEITSEVNKEVFSGKHILVDAIFGSGLSRQTAGIYAKTIDCLNEAGGIKIAVDIPSGLFADQHSEGSIFKAHHTVTFQVPKLAFFMPENYSCTGEWHVVDIGLHKKYLKEVSTPYRLSALKSIRKILKPRHKFDHKGKFGHALLIAGSQGKMGACTLAARAALRSGVGLLTLHVPGCGYTILQTAVPEAMTLVDSSEHFFTDQVETGAYQSIGIGPGLGQHEETVKAFHRFLETNKKPTVFDADALNMLAAHPEWQKFIPHESILTPHPREFERLAGASKNDFDRLSRVMDFSKKINAVVVLKGAYTTIACPDGNVYFNPTGNSGMAKGGSGDALTGILTALLAQGYEASKAAILGVYLHGLAGDLAVREKGHYSLLASDLIDFLPGAFVKTSQ